MEGSKSNTKAISEFVKELEALKSDALLRLGSGLANDEKLLGSLMDFLFSEQCSEEQQLLERFYSQMLRCYRTFDEHLMRFVCQFIFCFIWRHFSDLIKSRQYGIAIRPGLDALLIAIYNMTIVDSEGQPRKHAYTIASLSNPSLYHDPAEFTAQILRDSTRVRGEPEEKRVVIGNQPSVETLTRAKKWVVFRVLMRSLSQELPYHSKACQKSAIIMGRLLVPSTATNAVRTDVELSVKREAKPGLYFGDRLNFKSFSLGKEKARGFQIQPKIILDERFLLDAIDILYILAYQGLYEESLGLVMDLLEEGEYRCLASVVLLGNAVKSRLENSKLEPDDLDDVPPVNNGCAPQGEESGRKPPALNGSVREKRRRSFVNKKTSQASRPGESFHEIANDTDEPSRADTPVNTNHNNDSILETVESSAYRPPAPVWSPDVSPQQFIKSSPRVTSAANGNGNGNGKGISETTM